MSFFYKIIFFIITTLFFIICMFVVLKYKKSKNNGVVIVLNGPSVSGKSSIQKEFQYLMMPNLWIKLGIDNLFDKPMPDINYENSSFWQDKNNIRWVEETKDNQGNSIITLYVGNQGEKVAYGMNSAIAEYAKNGCNIIVDYIAYKKEWIDDLRLKLKGIKTIFVKVEIPLIVLEQREALRATSPKGHARSHYDFVYWDINYDIVVDSSKNSSEEIAKQIKTFIEK